MTPKRILILSEKGGFFGGVEQFIFQAAMTLRSQGIYCAGVFCDKARDFEYFKTAFDEVSFQQTPLMIDQTQEYDLLWIHKINTPKIWQDVLGKIKTAIYVHDHDYTCFRRHKYLPFTHENCMRKIAFPSCFFCGKMTKKQRSWRDFTAHIQLIKQVDYVMTNSKMIAKSLFDNGVLKEKISIISPLINLNFCEKKNYSQSNCVRFLYVGQVIRGKGVDLLIQAFSRMRTRENVSLDIIGSGDFLEKCKEMVIQNGLENKIKFHDYQMILTPFYQEADVFVFPSRWQEPYGMTGPEAMAHGLPVIGFDVGGVSEWLEHEKTGLLVEAANVNALASAMERMINEPALIEKMGRRAYKKISIHTQMRFVERFFNAIQGAEI